MAATVAQSVVEWGGAWCDGVGWVGDWVADWVGPAITLGFHRYMPATRLVDIFAPDVKTPVQKGERAHQWYCGH